MVLAGTAGQQRFQVNADPAAAGETDLPGHFIGYAILKQAGLSAFNDLQRLRDDGGFHAAAGDRTFEGPLFVDDQLAAARARRRSPGFDHGGDRYLPPLFCPVAGGLQNVFGIQYYLTVYLAGGILTKPCAIVRTEWLQRSGGIHVQSVSNWLLALF